MREIIAPSDRQVAGTFRRIIRRSLVLFSAMATLLAVGMWVVSYTGLSLSKPYWREFDHGHLSVYSPFYRCQCLISFGKRAWIDPYFSVRANKGRVRVIYRTRIAKGTIVPVHDIELAGCRWRQEAKPTQLHCAMGISDATFESLATTDEFTRSVRFPCWAPAMLFSACPIMAFVRGPYRRAARRAKGNCLKCGYDLTGLVEPRCPECGTPTKQSLVRDTGRKYPAHGGT